MGDYEFFGDDYFEMDSLPKNIQFWYGYMHCSISQWDSPEAKYGMIAFIRTFIALVCNGEYIDKSKSPQFPYSMYVGEGDEELQTGHYDFVGKFKLGVHKDVENIEGDINLSDLSNYQLFPIVNLCIERYNKGKRGAKRLDTDIWKSYASYNEWVTFDIKEAHQEEPYYEQLDDIDLMFYEFDPDSRQDYPVDFHLNDVYKSEKDRIVFEGDLRISFNKPSKGYLIYNYANGTFERGHITSTGNVIADMPLEVDDTDPDNVDLIKKLLDKHRK